MESKSQQFTEMSHDPGQSAASKLKGLKFKIWKSIVGYFIFSGVFRKNWFSSRSPSIWHPIINSQPMLRAKESACSCLRSFVVCSTSMPKMASTQKGGVQATIGRTAFPSIILHRSKQSYNNHKHQDLVTSHNDVIGMDPGNQQKPAPVWTLTTWSAWSACCWCCCVGQQRKNKTQFQVPTSISEGNPTCQVALDAMLPKRKNLVESHSNLTHSLQFGSCPILCKSNQHWKVAKCSHSSRFKSHGFHKTWFRICMFLLAFLILWDCYSSIPWSHQMFRSEMFWDGYRKNATCTYAVCQMILLDAQVPGGKCDILRILWGGHCRQTWNLHEFFYNMLPRMLASDCSCLQIECVSHIHAHTSFRENPWSCCTIFHRMHQNAKIHSKTSEYWTYRVVCVCV